MACSFRCKELPSRVSNTKDCMPFYFVLEVNTQISSFHHHYYFSGDYKTLLRVKRIWFSVHLDKIYLFDLFLMDI
jgi:hypothetical protein